MSDPTGPPFTTSGRGLLPNGVSPSLPVSYPGPVRVRVCRALANDWLDVADYFEVPVHQRSAFPQGHEPSQLWDWLESRGRLGELAAALRELGLAHCADMLEQR